MRRILVGFACNNACVFCAQGDLRASRPATPEIEVERALAAVEPGEVVAFTGGEPTLFAALPAWIRAATARGAASVIVQTNGRRLAYRAFAHALREASPRLRLDVSLHGATAQMHDWHTGTEGSFAQTVTGLRHARAERIPAGVTVVVTRSNYRHLAEIVRVAHAAGASALRLAPLALAGRALRDRARLSPAPALVAPYLQRAAAEAARLGIRLADRLGSASAGAVGPAEELFAGLGEVEPPPAPAEQVVEEAP
jgi:MoaA/NifB/PqqE/SkfB family radical SAM enzyme